MSCWTACKVELDDVQVGLDHLRFRAAPSGEPGGRRQRAEQAVRLAEEAGGEVDGVGVAAGAAVADLQRPQSIDLDWLAVGILQLASGIAGRGVEGVDAAVAEIAHQQHGVVVRGTDPGEARRRDGQPQGESSGPREIRRTLPPASPGVPSRLNTSTKPWPWPATSSCLAASCLA